MECPRCGNTMTRTGAAGEVLTCMEGMDCITPLEANAAGDQAPFPLHRKPPRTRLHSVAVRDQSHPATLGDSFTPVPTFTPPERSQERA